MAVRVAVDVRVDVFVSNEVLVDVEVRVLVLDAVDVRVGTAPSHTRIRGGPTGSRNEFQSLSA